MALYIVYLNYHYLFLRLSNPFEGLTVDFTKSVARYSLDLSWLISAVDWCFSVPTHNKKYHSGIRGIYITNTSTTMVFANEKNRSTTITVPRLLLPFP